MEDIGEGLVIFEMYGEGEVIKFSSFKLLTLDRAKHRQSVWLTLRFKYFFVLPYVYGLTVQVK